MIFTIHAKPRVGKSLHCVHLLEQLKADKNKNYHFIGNLEGYQFDETLPHGSSGKVKEEIITYLTTTDWEKKCQEHAEQNEEKLIFVFDECQSFLRAGTLQRQYKEQLLYFFEIAGHYGADIYLITQDWIKLDKEIQCLVHHVHVVSQTKIKGTNRVQVKNPLTWDVIETLNYPVKKYYDLYKSSHTTDGHQKIVSGFGKYVKILAVACVVGGYFIYDAVQEFTSNSGVKDVPVREQPVSNKPQIANTQQVQQKIKPEKPKNNMQLAMDRLRTTISHPMASEMFDGLNCIQITTHTISCPNIEKNPLFDRIFTSSYCVNNKICTYDYFDKTRYIADGLDVYCCLPDGGSTTSIASTIRQANNNQNPLESLF